MQAEPQKEHQWLQRLIGDWTFETEAVMEPGKPPMKFSGFESVRSLGGLWMLCEGRGEMPGGGAALTLMSLGYDPAKKRFLGTFVGSMMTHMWVYDGQLDAASNVLTLDTEGPSFAEPTKMVKYQDIIEIKSDVHRILRSRFQADDGKWHDFMTAHYRRTK